MIIDKAFYRKHFEDLWACQLPFLFVRRMDVCTWIVCMKWVCDARWWLLNSSLYEVALPILNNNQIYINYLFIWIWMKFVNYKKNGDEDEDDEKKNQTTAPLSEWIKPAEITLETTMKPATQTFHYGNGIVFASFSLSHRTTHLSFHHYVII